MRSLAFALLLLPGLALGDEVLVKGVERGKEYKLAVAADGSVTVVPLYSVTVGANPVPIPIPVPVPGGLTDQVKVLTADALKAGATENTATYLAVGYFALSDLVANGTVTPATLPARLKATNDALIPAAEVALWAKWRTGVGDALTQKIGTKDTAALALRQVSDGVKLAVEGSPANAGKAIDWKKIFDFLWPIILKILLEKFGL